MTEEKKSPIDTDDIFSKLFKLPPTRIYGRVPADPGWRAMSAKLDEAGKPLPAGEKYGGRAVQVEEVPIAAWALTDLGGGFGSIFGGAGARFQALDADGKVLLGEVIAPGETLVEAVDRVEKYQRESWEKKNAPAKATGGEGE